LTAGDDGSARLWDVAIGREVRRFLGHGSSVISAVFSADGRHVLTASADSTARLWDAQTGLGLRRFVGHSDAVSSAVLSSDGRRMWTASHDGTVELWETGSGKGLCSIISFRDGTWAVMDVEGRYDASDAGEAGPRWALGDDIMYLVQLKERYYEPGLLAKSAGFNLEPVRHVADLGRQLRAAPSLTEPWHAKGKGKYPLIAAGLISLLGLLIAGPAILGTPGDAPGGGGGSGLVVLGLVGLAGLAGTFAVMSHPGSQVHASYVPQVRAEVQEHGLGLTLANAGGGIGRTSVLVNGKEIAADVRGPKPDAKTARVQIDVPIPQELLLPGGQNFATVVARNGEGYLSRSVRVLLPAPVATRPDSVALWAIVGGVSEYASAGLRLKYAAKDARDMARALELGAKRLFGAERVHLTLLSSSEEAGSSAPTKANFRRAFAAARKARSTDVLVVYLAGHGVTIGGSSDTYCYLTAEARSRSGAGDVELADPRVRERCAITSEELVEWTRLVPANKQVLILDACAAGATAARLVESRGVSSSQVRAIDRLKDRTGFHVLMGCAADAVSYEATRYGQGVLTYALLEAMKGARLREGEYVDVSGLFNYARDRVPQLAREIGGVQRPWIAAPAGESFDIGQLTLMDREAIPLASVKPLILRPMLINREENDDDLHLSSALEQALRDASLTSRGDMREPPLVYVESDALPGAIRPVGTYVVRDSAVRVSLTLRQDDTKLAGIEVEGARDAPEALVMQLVGAVLAELTRIRP
jgi:hypothetical protein